MLLLWACVTFGLGTEAQPNITTTTGQETWVAKVLIHQEEVFANATGKPRHCQDIIKKGNVYEGHYVVYPEISATNKVSMVYCSQKDGMKALQSTMTNKEPARNCLDILHDGMTLSGPYVIYPYSKHPSDPVMVLCDQETDGGGWAVIQKRFDGTEEFYRPWLDYTEGFGNIGEEHYLGNDQISALTGQLVNELRVDFEAFDGHTAYAHYQAFHLNANANYQLSVFNYDGTVTDSLLVHNGMQFSTFDADHDTWDGNCAEHFMGGWWFKDCIGSNLNGHYYPDGDTYHGDGMSWIGFDGRKPMKACKMMVRPYSHTAALTGGLPIDHDVGGD